MAAPTLLGCCCAVLTLAAGATWSEERPPGGAERLLTAADIRGRPVGDLLVAAQPGEFPRVSRVSVSNLPATERIPVLYFALSATEPLGAQMRRAVKRIEGCGSRKDLVLTVRRCLLAAAPGDAGDALARKRATSVARALRSKGFRTEVEGSDLTTLCLLVPNAHSRRLRPVEVTVERSR